MGNLKTHLRQSHACCWFLEWVGCLKPRSSVKELKETYYRKKRDLYTITYVQIYIYKPGTLNNYFFKWLFSWMIPKLYFWEVIVSPNHFEVDASGTSNDIYIYIQVFVAHSHKLIHPGRSGCNHEKILFFNNLHCQYLANVHQFFWGGDLWLSIDSSNFNCVSLVPEWFASSWEISER